MVDNLSRGHRATVHPEAVFVQGDLANKTAVATLLQEHHPDSIIHFASHPLVGESVEKPFPYLHDNVVNALNLLEGAVKTGVRRFILSSTANLFEHPEKMPISENERIIPGSPYGESKYIIERILHWMDEVYGLKYACLRYFNSCGATKERGEHHDPETHLIPLALQVALGQRAKLIIYGDDYDTPDGTCIRDYVHVADLAQAHILALPDLHNGSRKYNLGSGQGFSVKRVIETARQVTGHSIPTEIGSRRSGDPTFLIASSETIMRDLGWQPKYRDLYDIIGTVWMWHQANPLGYVI